MALDNLAFVAMSKTDALDTLMAVNKEFSDAFVHVTKENEKLLNMVSQLSNNTMKRTMQTGNSKQLLLDPQLCHEYQPQ